MQQKILSFDWILFVCCKIQWSKLSNWNVNFVGASGGSHTRINKQMKYQIIFDFDLLVLCIDVSRLWTFQDDGLRILDDIWICWTASHTKVLLTLKLTFTQQRFPDYLQIQLRTRCNQLTRPTNNKLERIQMIDFKLSSWSNCRRFTNVRLCKNNTMTL